MTDQKLILPRHKIAGDLAVPISKSYAQRALALAALVKEPVCFEQLTRCDDVETALRIVESLGKTIQKKDKGLLLKGEFVRDTNHQINCGEAGLSTRLFSAFSLLSDKRFEISGEGSIIKRPMDMVIDALTQAGKNVQHKDGKLPLKINGQTKHFEFNIDGSTSSQLLTGLLIVSPFLNNNVKIQVRNLKSIPYVEMTLEIMKDFGLNVVNNDFSSFYIPSGQQAKPPSIYQVEGDWSGASFLIVAGLIGGSVKLKGLNRSSLQADKELLAVVEKVGGQYEWNQEELTINGGKLTPFNFDATHCPDLFPPLASLAAMIEGVSRIRGVHRLQHKESDRAAAIIHEFNEMGIRVETFDDELIIHGLNKGQQLQGGGVSSHNDHRMAMALALLSLRSDNPILIKEASSINKSYADFYEDLERITIA